MLEALAESSFPPLKQRISAKLEKVKTKPEAQPV
jgi:hypothetical protein